MPKRSLEEANSPAEGRDGEWVGRAVMLKPAAAQGKRLPETVVATVRRISRHAVDTYVLLEYTANGVSKTCTDRFPRREALSTRYIQVQDASPPLDQAQFMRQWYSQGPPESAAHWPPRSGEALSEVLPAFQLATI